jgi:hypothetical protein
MLTVIVSSVVLIAVGALATFSIVQLLPQELLAKAEKHGRFAGLGDDQAVLTQSPGAMRRSRTAWRNRAHARRQTPPPHNLNAPSENALRSLANER